METSSPAARLVTALWSTTRALKRHLSPMLRREHGVDFKDYMVLESIEHSDGAVHPGDLCAALAVTPSAVSRVLDDVSRRGLAVRELDHSDLRHIRVRLTPKGRALLSSARATMTDLVASWLHEKPRSQSEAVLAALESLSQHIRISAEASAEVPARTERKRSTRSR